MAKFDRDTIVQRLRAECAAGTAVYDALCGSGITAKMAARGGASMVTTHSLAYFRMQGLSSMAGYLPICDANALTLDLGERSLLNAVRECPVIAGLLCVDPTRDMERFVEKVAHAGYHGVMNCPTVALIDGKFRSDLEETGMGFAREVDVLGHASRLGLFTKAFCTSSDEALAMAEAGVDNIIIHFGNSSGGTIGSKTVMADDTALQRAASILDALKARHSEPHLHLSWRRDRDAGGLYALPQGGAAAAWLCRRLVGRALSHREIGGGSNPRVSRCPAAEGPLGG